MVTIEKRPTDGGYYFEIANFDEYVRALEEHGIEPPKARYRVFLSFDNERKLRAAPREWQRQLEVFYRVGASSEIPCEFSAEQAGEQTNQKGFHGQETNDNR